MGNKSLYVIHGQSSWRMESMHACVCSPSIRLINSGNPHLLNILQITYCFPTYPHVFLLMTLFLFLDPRLTICLLSLATFTLNHSGALFDKAFWQPLLLNLLPSWVSSTACGLSASYVACSRLLFLYASPSWKQKSLFRRETGKSGQTVPTSRLPGA